MAFIKLSASERRRVSAFITCCIVAFIAWLLTVLQGNYDYKVKSVLIYNNIPQRRAFRTLQSDTVVMTLRGSGWQMLSAQMHSADEHIPVDLHTLETKDYIAINTQLPQINSRRPGEQRITDFDPDTLYFDFTNRATKRVPVRLLKDVSYQQQFGLAGNPGLRPSYVFVSGPGNVISKIKDWPTDTLKLNDVSDNVHAGIRIAPVKDGNLNVYPKKVVVNLPVEEFTEKTIELPVQLTNNLHFYDIKVFPKQIKLTFMVPLSRYQEIDEDYFDATADLNLWTEHNYSSLPVKITRIPAYCKITKIVPQNIDFIIKK